MQKYILFALVVISFAFHISIIQIDPKHSGYDYEIYKYFGNLVLSGQNPYHAPANGSIPARYADMSPLNLAFFAGAMAVHPDGIRYVLALANVACIPLVYALTRKWWITILVAFNLPGWYLWTAVAEDKPVILLIIMELFLAVKQKKPILAVSLCALLAAYKFIGVFLILPLVFYFSKSRKDWIIYLGLFGILFALSHLPYFPDNLVSYKYRAERMAFNPPIHDSPLKLLSAIGLYNPLIPKVFPAVGLAVVYWLLYRRKLAILPALAWSIFLSNITSPEIGLDRILLITIPVLLTLINRPFLIKPLPFHLKFRRIERSIPHNNFAEVSRSQRGR